MQYLVDVIIVVIMLLCTFIGYKRGLIKVAVNILGFFLAIIISLTLYNPVSNFIINNTKIKDNIKQSISGTVEKYVSDDEVKDEKEDDNSAIDEKEKVVKDEEIEKDKNENVINDEKIETNKNEKEEIKTEKNESKIISNYIDNFVKEEKQKLENTKKEVIDNVSETVAINIIKVGSAILVFIVAKLILLIIKIFADAIGELPLIKQFNEAGGLIYGILQGLIIIYIVLAVISLIAPSLNNSAILDAINDSIIGKYMYDNNIILKVIFRD